MTPNQKIDGVPRDDLELVLTFGCTTQDSSDAWDRLRALLDAPVLTPLLGGGALEEQPEWAQIQILKNTVTDLQGDIEKLQADLAAQPKGDAVACAHAWTDDGEFTLTCTKCGKTENHEPYGWVQTRGNAINHFSQEWDVVESWEDQGFEYKAMYDHAEQPAPVAVALPERRQESGVGGADYYIPVGWNACLDEVTRMNAKSR